MLCIMYISSTIHIISASMSQLLSQTIQQPIDTSNDSHLLTFISWPLSLNINSPNLILYLCHAALSSTPYLYMFYSSCSFQPIPASTQSTPPFLSSYYLLIKPLPASLSSVFTSHPSYSESTFHPPVTLPSLQLYVRLLQLVEIYTLYLPSDS